MAKTIGRKQIRRPALVIAHNKTLAAQLANSSPRTIRTTPSGFVSLRLPAQYGLWTSYLHRGRSMRTSTGSGTHETACSRGAMSSWWRASRQSDLGSPEEYRDKDGAARRWVLRPGRHPAGLVKISTPGTTIQLARMHLPGARRRLRVHPACQDTVYRVSLRDLSRGISRSRSLTGGS